MTILHGHIRNSTGRVREVEQTCPERSEAESNGSIRKAGKQEVRRDCRFFSWVLGSKVKGSIRKAGKAGERRGFPILSWVPDSAKQWVNARDFCVSPFVL